MKTVIKILAVLILAIILYNYFLGTPEEKASSEKIFTEVKDLGSSVGNLIKEEHKKFKDGKYDDILDKLEDSYVALREAWKDKKPELMDQLNKLDEKRDELKKESQNPTDSLEIDRLKRELKQLLDETNDLIEKEG